MFSEVKKFFMQPKVFVASACVGILAAVAITYFIVSSLGEGEEEGEYSATVDSGIREQPTPTPSSTENPDDPPEEDNGDELVSVDTAQISRIEESVGEIINGSGNFGVNRENFNNQVTQDQVISDGIFVPRSESYRSIRDHIAENSVFMYTDQRINSWEEDAFAGSHVDSFTIVDILGPVEKNMSGEQVLSVDVEVNITGTEYFFEVTSNDTSWDGSYVLMEREYDDEGVVMELILSEDQWKLFDIRNQENVQATSLWSSPSPENVPFRGEYVETDRTSASREVFDDSAASDERANTPMDPSTEFDNIESDLDRGFKERMYSAPGSGGNL